MSLRIRILATTAPAICMVLGFLLIFSGSSSGNEDMTRNGWLIILVGFVLQVLWLFRRRISEF